MKIGDLVKVIDEEKQKWVKHNPWMAIKWGLDTVYIVVEEQPSFTKGGEPSKILKITSTTTGEHKWVKIKEVEVISASR